jgi:uncharacterized damage-inducible protein DinB
MTEIDRIARLLEKTFDKQPWYGCSIMEILSRVESEQSTMRQGDTHSISELVLHMASWRKFATQRLMGDAEFEVTDEANFPMATTWKDALAQLHQSQEALLAAVKQFPENRLAELVPSKTLKYTYYTLLHGIIQHDVYHLGQMALLQKLATRQMGASQIVATKI